MAHVTYIPPVDFLSGKCGQNAKIAFVHMRGSDKNYITHRPGNRRAKRTAAMSNASTTFANRSRTIRAILRDAALRAEYMQRFREQSTFSTFRAYLWNNV